MVKEAGAQALGGEAGGAGLLQPEEKVQEDPTAAPSYLQGGYQEHRGQALHSGGRMKHKGHNL